MTSLRFIQLVFVLVTASSCATGIVYTDKTRPLSLDMDNTPVGDVTAISSNHAVKEPISNFGITAEWSSYAPGDAVKRSSIDKINFADVRTVSFLSRVYQRRTVVVNGDSTE